MKQLSDHWLTEPCFDFEYKKYTLLDWWQQVETAFEQHELFPALSSVKKHYKELYQLSQNREKLRTSFPKEIKKINLEENRLEYNYLLSEDALIKELTAIIQYALPQFLIYLEEGKRLSQQVSQSIKLTSVGVIPLYQKEGYWLLQLKNGIHVFYYRLKDVHSPEVNDFNKIALKSLHFYENPFLLTPEKIKRELIQHYPNLPNPATYYSEASMEYPFQNTLLPLAGEQLYRFIAA